jgi:hypothetical protein
MSVGKIRLLAGLVSTHYNFFNNIKLVLRHRRHSQYKLVFAPGMHFVTKIVVLGQDRSLPSRWTSQKDTALFANIRLL